MRTLLSGELAQALDYSSDYYVKLEVQNGSGTYIDVSTYFDCIINAQWSEHINEPVSRATFTIVRNVDDLSFAPFMEGSSINVDDADAYAPQFEQGRGIRAYVATMPSGTPLDTDKYRQFFIGRIDEVNQTDVDGGATPIVLECSDLGAWLMDMQIEEGGTNYGDDDPLEDVLQQILDDNIPAGEPAVTLVKESTSDFAVTEYELQEEKVLSELIKVVLDSVGEDLRYRYDSSHVSQLTWFNPDRSRVTVDATISSYRLRKLNMAIDNIRNAGELPYVDTVTGDTGTVTSEDSASIAKFRRRFQRMPLSPLLTDATSAQATIDAVINDLSGAEADFEASCPLLWFVQLFDRYTFAADNKTYDSDQTFGVVGYQSAIESGVGQTVIQCSGRIVGAYAEWLKRIPGNSNNIGGCGDPNEQEVPGTPGLIYFDNCFVYNNETRKRTWTFNGNNWVQVGIGDGIILITIKSADGSAIPTGIHAYVDVPADMVMTEYRVFADQSCTLTLDVWSVAYAGFETASSSNSITNSAPIAITAGQKNKDDTLADPGGSDWAVSVPEGNVLIFNLSANDNAELIHASIRFGYAA